MIKNENKKRGVVSILEMMIIAIIIIFALSYFNISIKSVVESPTAQDNINYVGGASKTLWQKYLKDPAYYLWHDVWVNIFWQGFILNMERIRDGQPTDTQNFAPTFDGSVRTPQ
jgi:hypothetical protein